MSAPAFDRAAIERTYAAIRPYVRRTPLLELAAADFDLDTAPVQLKLEFLQHTGSFKPRGAFANLLAQPLPAAGVAAASGGNHGLAVAYAAKTLGARAKIFVPTVAAQAKQRKIAALGAELVVTGERYADALVECQRYLADSGALGVHAYDQPETILGQGSVGLELEAQSPGFDTLLVAVGGGGLIAGIAAWFAGSKRVIAVEPVAAPTLHDALRAGKPVDAPAGGVAADSLAPRQVGQLMFPIAQRHVAESLLVEDAAIVAAQRALWERARIVAEPGGATALAALLAGAYRPARDERVAVLVCGANSDAVRFD